MEFESKFREETNNIYTDYSWDLDEEYIKWLETRQIKLLEDIKAIKDEILIEIQNNLSKPNLGKKGCVRRLENILRNNI